MVKRCPPGVICVQNIAFFSLFFLILLIVLYLLIKALSSDNSNNNSNNNTKTFSFSEKVSEVVPSFNSIGSGLFPRPSYSFSNVENDILLNPYEAPLRDDRFFPNLFSGDIRGGVPINAVPINISTRAVDAEYRQVGILTRMNGTEMILPLMGRPLFTNRDKWNFYTMSNNNIKLPVINKKKSCTDEYGCDNLYSGDTVYVQGYNDAFKVTAYDNSTYKYLPSL
jgi:hypothetical protein